MMTIMIWSPAGFHVVDVLPKAARSMLTTVFLSLSNFLQISVSAKAGRSIEG
jgi:hypothetical protein